MHDRRVRIVCHPEADAAYIFSTDEALIQASILAGIAITIGLILVVIPGLMIGSHQAEVLSSSGPDGPVQPPMPFARPSAPARTAYAGRAKSGV